MYAEAHQEGQRPATHRHPRTEVVTRLSWWPIRTSYRGGRSAVGPQHVKTGARRARDLHAASFAKAERHETVCGCSHRTGRRRHAPCRTAGCIGRGVNDARDWSGDVKSGFEMSLATCTLPSLAVRS